MNASLRLIEGSFPEVGNVPNTEGALSVHFPISETPLN